MAALLAAKVTCVSCSYGRFFLGIWPRTLRLQEVQRALRHLNGATCKIWLQAARRRPLMAPLRIPVYGYRRSLFPISEALTRLTTCASCLRGRGMKPIMSSSSFDCYVLHVAPFRLNVSINVSIHPEASCLQFYFHSFGFILSSTYQDGRFLS